MRTTLFRAVLALAVVLAVTAPAAAQSVVRGKVVDAAGKPVEGATVSIEATEANRKARPRPIATESSCRSAWRPAATTSRSPKTI
jgi:hypothetical protein